MTVYFWSFFSHLFKTTAVLTAQHYNTILNHMVKYMAENLDAVFSALGDTTRRAILAQLADGEARVTDLAAPYAMSLPAISKHLRVLETAGLIRKERQGRVIRCALAAEPLREAADWVEQYRQFWEQQFDRLASYLEETTPQTGEKDD